MRQVIIATLLDGSGILGAYGPYAGPENAKEAMARLKTLPGMGSCGWQILPLNEIFTTGPKEPVTR